MTAVHMVVLSCDAPYCQATFSLSDTAAQVRSAARSTGWRHRRAPSAHPMYGSNIDLCPEHS